MSQLLSLDAACLSEVGGKSSRINEDYVGQRIPTDKHLLHSKGAVLAVADGVSSAGAGREASEEAIERFCEEYYQTPDTWSVAHCGEKILSTVNTRLYRRSHDYAVEGKGFLTTFSSVVIKGQLAHFFHAGDSRIYLLRKTEQGHELKQLSQDHSRSIADGQSFLIRAVGMDNHLPLDYGKQPLQEGDRLLLCSDGISDFIDSITLQKILSQDQSMESICRELLDCALQNNSDDNISAVVAQVQQLPKESLDDKTAKLTRLPFPPELEAGMILDGYTVIKELFASSRSQLYLVKDCDSGRELAMKIPSRNFEDDSHYIDRFIQEEWVGQRIQHENVVAIERPRRVKTALYYLMEYVPGIGLDRWIEQNQPPSPKQAFAIIKQLAAGLRAFHENEAIHQDLKPANVMITPEGRVLLLDFGSVYVAGLAELEDKSSQGALGTAGYSDPLYLEGKNPGIAGDVYSLATIAYEMFCGRLPYGEGVEECRSAADYARLRYSSIREFNARVPVWFDRALEKGVAFDLEERYGTIDGLLKDLSQPNLEFLKDDPVTQRGASSLLFWKLLSGFWVVLLLVLVYLFSQVK